MPSEYEKLVAALKLTDYPVAEFGWDPRPEGAHIVVSLDFEADHLDGDDGKRDRSWEASVDAFFHELTERDDIISTVEEILEEVCGASWEMNSMQHETAARMFHIEWACRVRNLRNAGDEAETEAE